MTNTKMHYAVWKWRSSYFMLPACDLRSNEFLNDNSQQGITINRGDVNCPDCKRMMGMAT